MLPRLIRRLIWVWGLMGGLLLTLIVLSLVLPKISTPGVVPGEQTTIILRSPSGDETTLLVDLADSPDERRRGLQNRPVVEAGMLFAFEDETDRSFWMKDTLVPLDIFFFHSDGSFVSGHRMEPCLEDPCPSTLSGGPAKFALELSADGSHPDVTEGWSILVHLGS